MKKIYETALLIWKLKRLVETIKQPKLKLCIRYISTPIQIWKKSIEN